MTKGNKQNTTYYILNKLQLKQVTTCSHESDLGADTIILVPSKLI